MPKKKDSGYVSRLKFISGSTIFTDLQKRGFSKELEKAGGRRETQPRSSSEAHDPEEPRALSESILGDHSFSL